MLHPQDNPEACEQLIRLFLINATRPDFTLNLLCDDLQSNPDKLWKFCQDAFGHPPSDLLDWARARVFLEAVRFEPMMRLRHLGKRLGFKSESAFNQFTHRVFGTTPQGAKGDPRRAEERVGERYKAIEECYEQMMQRESGNPKPKQTKRVERVLTKRNPETENRNRKPKQKTETENRNGKPKQKTENDFFWKKEKKKVR